MPRFLRRNRPNSFSLGLSALLLPLASAFFLNPDDQSRPSQLTSMLRAGAILLTVWTGLKLAISLGILFMLLVLGKNSPALLVLYGDAQGKGLEPRALATINGLAVVANASSPVGIDNVGKWLAA